MGTLHTRRAGERREPSVLDDVLDLGPAANQIGSEPSHPSRVQHQSFEIGRFGLELHSPPRDAPTPKAVGGGQDFLFGVGRDGPR